MNIPIVEFVLERDQLAHESQRAQHQEFVSGLHQDEDTTQQVLVQYAILYMVRVMFDAEREQLQNEPQELDAPVVLLLRLIMHSILQQRRFNLINEK